MASVFLVSDIHAEFYKDGGKSIIDSFASADAICVAGDLGTSKTMSNTVDLLCNKYLKVIVVLGNHDFFYSSFEMTMRAMDKLRAKYNNLVLLENERVVINDQGFIGATLWYKPNRYRHEWSDYLYIKGAKVIPDKHEESKDYLRNNIQEGDIVITHMLPSYKCVAPRYKDDEWNCYFVGECEDIVIDKKPKIWHSGHTHTAYDFTLNASRMICNAVGYPREAGTSFNPALIVRA